MSGDGCASRWPFNFSEFMNPSIDNNPYESPQRTGCAAPKEAGTTKLPGHVIGGMLIGTVTNTAAVFVCLPILSLEPGSMIEPFFGNLIPCSAVLLGITGLVLCIIGIPTSSPGYRWLGVVGIVVSCAPRPLCSFLLLWLASITGVSLEN